MLSRMAADEPPYLTVGTDVSAKYKGAFCEAKIKKVNRIVKCKVTFKNNMGSAMVTDDQVRGVLRIGADVEAKHPDKNQFCEATINKLQDSSQYTVVFDDGDETTLRRTSLCLKSGRHFAESPTLDQFPLTNPEHFGTPVIGSGKPKRKRRSTMNSALDYESSDEELIPKKLKAIRAKERNPDLGKIVCVEYGDRRKKDNWYPALVVPHPAQANIKISKEEYLIRSFKDGKYYQVPKRNTREFTKETILRVDNNTLRAAVEKAMLYYEKEELPPHWDKALFIDVKLPSADEESQDTDSDTSDDEPSEEKDRFVAQLYKFMDERGTPINKAPTVGSRDLNLYKLFKMMHKFGGYNKVTNQNKWKTVYLKMGLPSSNPAGSNQIKIAYKRYLHSFENFNRKLGCTMVTNSRSTRGRHRSDRNFIITRNKEQDIASSRSKRDKDKGSFDKKTDEKSKSDKKDIKLEEKSKTYDKKKTEKVQSEDKDEKYKQDKPRLIRSHSLIKDKRETSMKEDDKKDVKTEKARTREDARKEKNDSPEKKGTRSASKIEVERKECEEAQKDRKEKDKKDEKGLKDIKEEKVKDKKEDKNNKEKVSKDKKDFTIRDKKDENRIKDKRGSSKEETPFKGKREEVKCQTESKSPLKKKQETILKDKKDEKLVKLRTDDKSPSLEVGKEFNDNVKAIVEKNNIKDDVEIKKEDIECKDKVNVLLLREKKENVDYVHGVGMLDIDIADDKEGSSQDGFEKLTPGCKIKEEDCEELHLRSKKMGMQEEKDSYRADSDDEFTNDSDRDFSKDIKNSEINIGDRVKVKYGRGWTQKAYEAKVLKIELDLSDKRYFVHYAGWNTRYDEWVRRKHIVAIINGSKKQKQDCPKALLPSTNLKKTDKGRPPCSISNAKVVQKNSNDNTTRATRSDKKSLQTTPLSSGFEPRKRIRKKSGVSPGVTDNSQESDNDDSLDLDEDATNGDVEDNTSGVVVTSFKEELFSDDEENEDLEDVKRGDITELEKAIFVEETIDNIKDSFLNNAIKKDMCEVKNEKDNSMLFLKDHTQTDSLRRVEQKPNNDVHLQSSDKEYKLTVVDSINVCSLNPQMEKPFEQVEDLSATHKPAIVDKVWPDDESSKTNISPKATSEAKVEKLSLSSCVLPTISVLPNVANSTSKPLTAVYDIEAMEKKLLTSNVNSKLTSINKPDVTSQSADKDIQKDGNIIFQSPNSEHDGQRQCAGNENKLENIHEPEKKEPYAILDENKNVSFENQELFKDEANQNIPSIMKSTVSNDYEIASKGKSDEKSNNVINETKAISEIKNNIVSVSLTQLHSYNAPNVTSHSPIQRPKSPDGIDTLSGSNSSNSLKICENMSDKNDSNSDLKESISEIMVPTSVSSTVCRYKKESTHMQDFEECSNDSKHISKTSYLDDKTSNAHKTATSVSGEQNALEKSIANPVQKLCLDVNTFSKNDYSKTGESKSLNKVKDEIKLSEKNAQFSDKGHPSKNPEILKQNIVKIEVRSNITPENKDSVFDDLFKINSFTADCQSTLKKQVTDVKDFTLNTVKMCASEENVIGDKDKIVLHNTQDIQISASSESHALSTIDASFDGVKNESGASSSVFGNKISSGNNECDEDDFAVSLLSKKDGKRKKSKASKLEKCHVSSETNDKDESKDFKMKDSKSKSKRRAKVEIEDIDKGKESDVKSKSKKIKKNRNKKRFPKHEDQCGDSQKKIDSKDYISEKLKKKEKHKNDKKFLKSNIVKSDDASELKNEFTKKKKGKKNRDKLNERKEFSEKKTKRRKKHIEDNQDTDSEKDSSKVWEKKRKRDRKKYKTKECSSSDDGVEKFYKQKNKDSSKMSTTSDSMLKHDTKSEDPDMSFLLCEEKVLASPVGTNILLEDTSGSSGIEENNSAHNKSELEIMPSSYSHIASLRAINKPCLRSIETCAVLDNTPPSTPSSTESLLSSSPREQDAFSLNCPETTQSGGEADVFHCAPNRTMLREREEYCAAATLAFAVGESLPGKSKYTTHSFLESQKSETEDIPQKRKRKNKRVRRCSESAKSPRHKSSIPRISKVEGFCEDSSEASVMTSYSPPYGSTSSLGFTKPSPHRLSSTSETSSKYNFYVSLHDKDPEKRIVLLEEKMAQIRKEYMAVKAEISMIDQKRKKARKKTKHSTSSSNASNTVLSEDAPIGS